MNRRMDRIPTGVILTVDDRRATDMEIEAAAVIIRSHARALSDTAALFAEAKGNGILKELYPLVSTSRIAVGEIRISQPALDMTAPVVTTRLDYPPGQSGDDTEVMATNMHTRDQTSGLSRDGRDILLDIAAGMTDASIRLMATRDAAWIDAMAGRVSAIAGLTGAAMGSLRSAVHHGPKPAIVLRDWNLQQVALEPGQAEMVVDSGDGPWMPLYAVSASSSKPTHLHVSPKFSTAAAMTDPVETLRALAEPTPRQSATA
jgi:hypothetical protein